MGTEGIYLVWTIVGILVGLVQLVALPMICVTLWKIMEHGGERKQSLENIRKSLDDIRQ